MYASKRRIGQWQSRKLHGLFSLNFAVVQECARIKVESILIIWNQERIKIEVLKDIHVTTSRVLKVVVLHLKLRPVSQVESSDVMVHTAGWLSMKEFMSGC